MSSPCRIVFIHSFVNSYSLIVEIGPFDVVAISELGTIYTPQPGTDLPDGQECPHRLITTFSNMSSILDIKCDRCSTQAWCNGYFAWTDFMLWTQWYCQEQEHFVYIIHHLYSKTDLASHPLSIMWWDMDVHDFIEERESCYEGLGKLTGRGLRDLEMFEHELASRVNDQQKARRCHTAFSFSAKQ